MKKKILTIALVAALLATCFAGTFAYLTDTHSQVNTFTTGNVLISLDEAEVKQDEAGNLVAKLDENGEEVRTTETQSYHLYPAMTVTKDPTIYVKGSEPAYVAAKVIINGDLHPLIGVTGYDNIDITKIASGGLITTGATQENNWNGLSMVYKTNDCVIYQDADKANNTWTLYIFMEGEQAVGNEIELFDTLTIDPAWGNTEMAKINGMNIEVQAFAAQTNGFADCYSAMTVAFKDAFPFATNP